MKSYKILTIIFLVSIIRPLYAALPTGAALHEVNVPTLCGGPTFGITALHWETSTPHYDYILTYPADDLGLTFLGEGKYHSVSPDSRWNYKVNVGYIFPCSGNDITFSFLGYHQHTIDDVSVDALTTVMLPTLSDEWPTFSTVTIDNPFLAGSFSLFVPGVNIDDLSIPLPVLPNLARAKANINHHVADLDFGQYINVGSNTRIKYYAGIRYANLENKLNAIYNFSGIDTTDVFLPGLVPETGILVNLAADFTETIKQASDFEGIGPKLGVDFNHSLCWGFGLVSSLSVSILAGRIDTHLNEDFTHLTTAIVVDSDIPEIALGSIFSTFTENHENFKFPNQTRIVPNIDAKVGLDYSYQWCNCERTKLTIEAGYMVSHYFNIVDRVSEIGIDKPEFRTRHTIDQHFEGLYLSLQVNV